MLSALGSRPKDEQRRLVDEILTSLLGAGDEDKGDGISGPDPAMRPV
jgi:hypothetical protein